MKRRTKKRSKSKKHLLQTKKMMSTVTIEFCDEKVNQMYFIRSLVVMKSIHRVIFHYSESDVF